MSDIGIIGATYEDRRTKKKGKLIERDEKYKTLLMESSDGKSFNITFGSFKSNWRKVDEPEQTVEEAMTEEVPEEQIKGTSEKAKSAEKPKKKTEKKQVEVNIDPDDEKSTFLGEVLEKIMKFAEEFDDISVSPSPVKFTVAAKMNRKKLFEVYAKHKVRRYNTIISSDIVEGDKRLMNLCELRNFKAGSCNADNVCLMLKPENVDDFLSIMKDVVRESLVREE